MGEPCMVQLVGGPADGVRLRVRTDADGDPPPIIEGETFRYLLTAQSLEDGCDWIYTPSSAQCGDQDVTSDGDVLTCDLPRGHEGPHSCVIVPEQRMAWLGKGR